jgi:hypothetical protein
MHSQQGYRQPQCQHPAQQLQSWQQQWRPLLQQQWRLLLLQILLLLAGWPALSLLLWLLSLQLWVQKQRLCRALLPLLRLLLPRSQ